MGTHRNYDIPKQRTLAQTIWIVHSFNPYAPCTFQLISSATHSNDTKTTNRPMLWPYLIDFLHNSTHATDLLQQ